MDRQIVSLLVYTPEGFTYGGSDKINHPVETYLASEHRMKRGSPESVYVTIRIGLNQLEEGDLEVIKNHTKGGEILERSQVLNLKSPAKNFATSLHCVSPKDAEIAIKSIYSQSVLDRFTEKDERLTVRKAAEAQSVKISKLVKR